MRRALPYIAAVIAFLAGLGIIAYFLFFTGAPNPRNGTTGGNPFGTSTTGAGSNGTGAQGGNSPANAGQGSSVGVIGSRLVRIDAGPVAPGMFIRYLAASSTPAGGASTTPQTAELDIRYVNRQTGNMYSRLFYKGITTRLTDATIPGIRDVVWSADGQTAYVRYISDTSAGGQIATYGLPASGAAGFFLASGIEQLLAAGANSLLALAAGDTGSTVFTSAADGSSRKTLIASPLSSARIGEAGTGRLLVTTMPSASVGGYAYLADEKSGAWTRILGPLPGLIALPSPTGAYVLASYDDASGLPVLELYDVAAHQATTLPLRTLADKCAWGPTDADAYCAVPTDLPKAAYPDDWYQGAVSFSDKLWKIDVTNRFTKLIVDFKAATGSDLDGESLTTDSHDEMLTFVNKTDRSLWAYDL
ncbi:hypothetical protein KGQ55_03135 [Patescibacteria group bacterium]|nr:hypothetical protein [Patescibacteria group bacterium]